MKFQPAVKLFGGGAQKRRNLSLTTQKPRIAEPPHSRRLRPPAHAGGEGSGNPLQQALSAWLNPAPEKPWQPSCRLRRARVGRGENPSACRWRRAARRAARGWLREVRG